VFVKIFLRLVIFFYLTDRKSPSYPLARRMGRRLFVANFGK